MIATRVAHTLKGVAGNLGITGVFEAAAVVEAVLKEGESGDQVIGWSGDQEMEDLKLAVDNVLMDLEKLAPSEAEHPNTGTPEHLITFDAVKDKLEKLKQLLEQDDAEAKEILDKIGPVDGYEKEFQEIRDLVDAYDFSEALEILSRLK